MLLIFLFLALLFPETAIAQSVSDAAGGEVWYKAVVGIIGIPAALLGLLVTWNANKKTRLETRKLELELAEKQKAIQTGTSPAEKIELLAEPLGQSQLALILVVRFVLLYLTLQLWGVVPAAFTALMGLVGGTIYGAIWLFQPSAAQAVIENTPIVVAVAMLPQGLRIIFSLMTWAILLGFGWPLLKDTCAFLNIPIKSLFDLPVLWRRK